MEFEHFRGSILLDDRTILNRIDEYTLYCYYTGIDDIMPGRCYNAGYRNDRCPSFSFYKSNRGKVEYMWKDQATGESGTIFHLIQRLWGLETIEDVYAKINEDFALGFDSASPVGEKITLYDKPQESIIKIRVSEIPLTEKGVKYWDQLRIDKPLLDRYYTSQISYYWSYEGQAAPTTAADPTFAYRIGAYYQLYSPYNTKQFKFRNDLPENYFFGYIQLPPTGKVLDIDKSCKDVIFCARLGYNAVCGKSETTMIPHNKMLELFDRFETIYLTLDPDAAGRQMTDKYMSLYPKLKPRFLTNAKDKTDLCLKVGFDEAKREIDDTLS